MAANRPVQSPKKCSVAKFMLIYYHFGARSGVDKVGDFLFFNWDAAQEHLLAFFVDYNIS